MTEPGARPEDLLQPLDPEACARLLAATELGRIAVVVDGRPRLVVLNHVIDSSDVLFRTRDDSLLADLTRPGAPVHAVYEVDSAFPVGRSGWSVIATGTLVRESEPARIARARELVAWAEGARDLVLRLDVTELTGRRVGPL